MKYNHLLFCTALLCSLLLIGCSSKRIKLTINSISSPESQGLTHFVLGTGETLDDSSSLIRDEYLKFTETAMHLENFTSASTPESSDIIIIVDYTISGPESEAYSYAVPVYGTKSITSRTTGRTFATATSNSYGNSTNYTGNARTRSSTTYTPNRGITHYETKIGFRTVYTKTLVLNAYSTLSLSDTAGPKEAWRVVATCTDEYDNLRELFPIMLAGAQPYLGRSSSRDGSTVWVGDADKRVLAITKDADVN